MEKKELYDVYQSLRDPKQIQENFVHFTLCYLRYRYHDHDLLSLQTFHYNKSWFWYFSTVV